MDVNVNMDAADPRDQIIAEMREQFRFDHQFGEKIHGEVAFADAKRAAHFSAGLLCALRTRGMLDVDGGRAHAPSHEGPSTAGTSVSSECHIRTIRAVLGGPGELAPFTAPRPSDWLALQTSALSTPVRKSHVLSFRQSSAMFHPLL
ncbi:hypothetical protein PtB15_11B532 [Puccinia triticina]|nr:hypothetical protein PtB15_11B532 [Puccinia triticina]